MAWPIANGKLVQASKTPMLQNKLEESSDRMLKCLVHPSSDGPSGVLKSWSFHSSFERKALSPRATTYILPSRQIFSKTPGDKYSPFKHMKPDLDRKLITRKLKTVIKVNYCNSHHLTYPTRCSHKKQIMRKKTISRNTQTDFTQTQQKLCCNFETVIIAHYFNISRPSSVSHNIMKICAKMYSMTMFSSLPRTIDHREGGTGNMIFNKTSSGIYRKEKKLDY